MTEEIIVQSISKNINILGSLKLNIFPSVPDLKDWIKNMPTDIASMAVRSEMLKMDNIFPLPQSRISAATMTQPRTSFFAIQYPDNAKASSAIIELTKEPARSGVGGVKKYENSLIRKYAVKNKINCFLWNICI